MVDREDGGVTQKYPKPNILLLDLPDNIYDTLQSAGFNVSSGSFGSPYRKHTSGDSHLIYTGNIESHTEQEVIFIDLTKPEILNEYQMVEMKDTFVANREIIDPRPQIMSCVTSDFNRILKFGGIFVIFAQPRKTEHYMGGRKKVFFEDNWSFLSTLSNSHLQVVSDSGHETIDVNLDHLNDTIGSFVRMYCQNIEYTATLSAHTFLNENEFECILKNKFGECISAIITPHEYKGLILILPQISKEPEVFLQLLTEVLPEIGSYLFPYAEGQNWIDKDEYAIGSVLELKVEKNKVIQDCEKKIGEIDQKISNSKDHYSHLYRIITSTGDELVDDIEKNLSELINFNKVRNIDKELEYDENHQKQEDLQICDRSIRLLVEIKGIAGYPSESDMNQVNKYVNRRMKEWGDTNVRGVTIINHYKNIEPLLRLEAFTEAQIKDAEITDVTILTTWDLFLLIKGMIQWNWDKKNIQDLFYISGRMSKVPTHYKEVGKILNYYKDVKAITVQLTDKLIKGDRVGYFLKDGFYEEDVLSLQCERIDVEEVNSGFEAGIKTIYSSDMIKKGISIYKVES
jgi:hypothetical protein